MNDQILIKMALDSWHLAIKRANALFEKLTDEVMLNEVAPNRNRGIYLIGHLTAVNDAMLPLFDLGDQKYPELTVIFLSKPDDPTVQPYSVAQLRQYWVTTNSELQKHFDNLKPDQWFQKHNSISAEDFAKEPHRNRLNVVLSRTNHIHYHLGQLAFLEN